MAVALVNGRSYSHTDIIANIGGVPVLSISNLTINDTQDKSFSHGTSRLAVAYGEGKKNATEISI